MSEIKNRKGGKSPQSLKKELFSSAPSSPEKQVDDDPAAKHKADGKRAASSSSLAANVSLFLLTLLAVVTRAWLSKDSCISSVVVHHPGQVVFDEVHFGKFASYYLRGEYYFDVHPPLGKMLIAGVGYLVGYDGHFLFDNIGDDYLENNVPYLALRLWCALCGAAVVPFAFLILQAVGVSVLGCTLGGLLLVFDNALTTQSRLILLDSMLMLFCTMSIYFWIRFHKARHSPFSLEWWTWLCMSGVGLALVTGVKMVGLFTVATVGIATLFDLWQLLDIRRGYSMAYFGKHFAARALCLIVLPWILYLVPFYLHFALLPMSGPGDSFMSLEFQAELKGNTKTQGSTQIPFGSIITLEHQGTGHYLHSHPHRYPLRYEDGRISSEGQQVNAYAHPDGNSAWEIVAIDQTLFPDPYVESDEEKARGIRWLRHESLVRLRHVGTDTWLLTHDVASPLTKTNMEITTVDYDRSLMRYNETIWKIVHAEQEDMKLRSKKDMVFIINNQYNVALHTFKKALPEWGFKMQEMNGNKKTTEPSNRWTFMNVTHSSLDTKEAAAKKAPEKKLSFLRKFLELQGLMIHHNNALTKTHPYSSTPITWPFVIRGVSFWETKEGLKQIYLLGNPFAWFMHWGPFFLMGRMLFLHHYMPAYIFSAITTTALVDFIFRDFVRPLWQVKSDTPMVQWRGPVTITYVGFVVLVLALVLWAFMYFAPLTYGMGFPDVATLRAHKWFSTWDLQYA
ncbi:hypothetical protein HDV03_002347 [Kappamyces sp. JEL0829]|nr:hypothetical protein HDV03_002347 [Kappamyces sp. JEL0829]